MEPTMNPPNLFFTENNNSLPVTAFEKEIFLTTTIGQPTDYTIRAYPNQRIEIHLNHPPLHGKVDFQSDNRTVSYRPDPSFKGIDTFSCHLRSEPSKVTVLPFTAIINSPNANAIKEDRTSKPIEKPSLSPFISVSQFTTRSGKKLIKDIPVYEESEEPYTISLKKPSTHGRVEVFADGTFEYTPSIGFQGKDSFQISQHFAERTENITIEVLILKPTIKKQVQIANKIKKNVKRKKQ